ncbi:MAG: polysaccharide biosynthesis protein, partial [Oscillospiraceae bacterium]|nr:polysaccharide biosynthesis protein [Oscillospiraceae bacterium]
MSQPTKKQTFLHGAALLALATAVVKVIGALYKIPLKMVIGDQGYGYFTTAYDIYSVLLMISTAGLPVAMSRMISQAAALDNYNQVRRVYKAAGGIFLGLGTISTLLMMCFAGPLARWLEQPNASWAILFLGPCAFFMGLISTYRGFFQGQGDMRPTSSSQVLEAVFKLLVGLGAAFSIMYFFKSVPLAAGGAILGVTVSCAISVVYLYRKFRPAYDALPDSPDEPLSYGTTIKGLLAIALPITVGSAGLQLLTVFEQKLYMSQLLGSVGMSQDSADTVKGIYSMSLTIFNMPCAFIVPICVSIIPAITSNLTLHNDQGVRETEESAARITGLISLPCSVGLCLLAKPVMSLLGDYTGEKLELAGSLMAVLGLCIFLYGIIQFTNSVMQAHGFAYIPVVNMLVAGIAKLAVVDFLVGNPNLGILGAPIGALLSYTAIAVMNLIAIAKVVPQKPALLKNLLRALIPAALMGVAVYGAYWGLTRILGENGSRIILCGAPILVGIVVYCVCVVLFKSITKEDCALLPKGEKIAKLFR